jgi:SAM-dependent methyltransferase
MGGPMLSFVCNICDGACLVRRDELSREQPSCATCGSSVRTRAIVHLLSMGLFGRSLALRDFPHDRCIRGVGLSDWAGYAVPLAERLDYRNTHFHGEPRLDITDIPDAWVGAFDFVIAAEAFEHVLPPVQRAFDGVKKLLKPGGLLILTVPFDDKTVATREHFPGLNEFSIVDEGGTRRLYNVRQDGETEVFEDLIFHGGSSSTLEMRLFSLAGLLENCAHARFRDTRVADGDVLERGITWLHPWSVPLVATT